MRSRVPVDPELLTIPQNSCYELVTTGNCPFISTCPYSHPITRICTVCYTPKHFLSHEFANHVVTKKHEKGAARQRTPAVPVGYRWCIICQCHFVGTSETALRLHYDSIEHENKSQHASLQLQNLVMSINKRMFKIKGSGKFGDVEQGIATTRPFLTKTPRGVFKVMNVAIVSPEAGGNAIPFELLDQSRDFPLEVTGGNPLEFQVSFQHPAQGQYQCTLGVTYKWPETEQIFHITKKLKATVKGSGAHERRSPQTPRAARSASTQQTEKVVIGGGAQPPSLTVIQYTKRMAPALIPAGLASAIAQGSMKKVLEAVRKSHLPAKFNNKSYGAHFKVLLWIEEAKANEDMLLYDMEGVRLQPHKSHYWLEVPGLAEKRPSVILGDRILIRRQTDAAGHWFEGRVWDVQQLRVDLQLPGRAAKITAQSLCDVRFKLNRIPLQRQHQALDIINTPERITFPKLEHAPAPTANLIITSFVNPLVGINPRQAEAVKSILSQPAGSVPFIIFGPPGTGKTVTTVEAINQILKTDATARILACAPSNPAADIIARRLIPLGNKMVFRLYAPSRLKKLVDNDLLPFTFTHKSGPFSVPPLAQLMAFRVVVTTCISAAIPFNVGVPSGHFTHIFIDEAGQASEPEAMVSIRTMAGPETNVILSGDPKQLGPVIRSGVARELGLGKSYLERVMENPLYDEVTGSTNNVVKLTKNFRSHPAILRFPNDEFYRGDLESCGDTRVINSFVRSPILPERGRNFPVVFHAISGKDERESTSPSFFNLHEVTTVRDYVERLKSFGIAEDDIGIVTPYRAQCQKIRMTLRSSAERIKIGSVEEFQGDERLVIIISTVRSNADFLEYDARFTLGFVSNPQRFNVAVTRAKALLLVVGDPRVLSLDPLWRSFMNFVHTNGGWKGTPPDWDTTAPVDQSSDTYIQERRESAQDSVAEVTSWLHSLNVEYDPAGVDRPAFVELE